MFFQKFLAANNKYITVNAYLTPWIYIWAYRIQPGHFSELIISLI